MFRLFAIVALIVYWPGLEAQVNHRAFIQQARFELSEERFTDALRSLNTAINVRPDLFEPWFLRGVAKYNLGDFSGAESDFSESLRLHPLNIRSYHYRGLTRLRLANYHNALQDFRKALELDPYDAGLRLAIGDALLNLNKPAEAIDEYRMALTIQPRLAEAWLKKGMAAKMMGNTDDALNDMTQAVQYNYFSLDARLRLAMLKAELGKTTDALNDFDELQRIHPDEPIVYFQRAMVEIEMSDTASALRSLGMVNKLEPANALALYNRALIYSRLKDYNTAIGLYGEVLQQQPRHILSWFNRGVAYLKINAFPEAEQDFSKAIVLFPGFVAAWLSRAEAREGMKNFRGAADDRETAARLLDEQYQPEVPGSPFRNDSLWFNKIMRLESEFAGPALADRPQFRQQEVTPFGLFVLVAVQRGNEGQLRRDALTSALDLSFHQNVVFGFADVALLESLPLLAIEAETPLQQTDFDTFIRSLHDFALGNYSHAISGFESITESSLLYLASRINLSAAVFVAETLKNEAQLPLQVSISRSAVTTDDQPPLDQPYFSKATEILQSIHNENITTAMFYHNLGFLLLRSGRYHPSIDAYSDALNIDPTLGESWFNRALVLLFLSENRLACSDLSKAGEQGIVQAYALIRRYCIKP
ncbi:MAG TPA: tetratricopeptide repeat protein [Bacteroidales bacterium]|nr:tetratricopeptide repeat protein [Bacteroidales bacterium]